MLGYDVYINYIDTIMSVLEEKEWVEQTETALIMEKAHYIDDIFYINNLIKLGMKEKKDIIVQDINIFLSDFSLDSIKETYKELELPEEVYKDLERVEKGEIKTTSNTFVFDGSSIEDKLKAIEDAIKGIKETEDKVNIDDKYAYLLEDDTLDSLEDIEDDLTPFERARELFGDSWEEDEETYNDDEDDAAYELEENTEVEDLDIKDSDVEDEEYVKLEEQPLTYTTLLAYKEELHKRVQEVKGVTDTDRAMAEAIGSIFGVGLSIGEKIKKKVRKDTE